MPAVSFYHLQSQDILEALPKLAEKMVAQGLRGVVRVGDAAALKTLDKALWTYKADSFLSHDAVGGADDNAQDILLSVAEDNRHQREVLLLVNAIDHDDFSAYQRVVYMFDGNDETIVAKARDQWKALKEQAYDLSYWQQGDRGGWQQKA